MSMPRVNPLAEAFREALTDPKLEAMKRLEEQMTRIEAQLSVAAVLTDAKLDSILEKLACVSTLTPSSNKPKRY